MATRAEDTDVSLAMVLSGTMRMPGEARIGPTDKYGNATSVQVKTGDPVLIVGVIQLGKPGDVADLICVNAEGAIFFANPLTVKVTIGKDLRERLAEATLTT